MIGRRALLATAVGLVLAPFAAAQPPPGKTPRIGYLSIRSGPSYLDEAFRQGLCELGYIEGQNISVEFRWADWRPERAAAMAGELVRLKVDMIVSTGGAAPLLAARKATSTIPIVFTAGDPVGAGAVASHDRPGGNATGINILTVELNPKRLEILKEAVPGVSRVAVLANPKNPATPRAMQDLASAAQALRLRLQILEVPERQELDGAFAALARERPGGLLVPSDPMYFAQRERIVDLALKHRLPGVFEWREFAEAGGLLSYGPNLAVMYQRLATYVDKILKGSKPADLPIEQPTKFELVINLKTARTLGLTIPQSLLLRADQVIR